MRWLMGPLAAALAGCSLIYNPNNLPRMVDAVPDADPCALALSDITPKVINEGQGTGGSLPALLVIRGNNIVNANLTVELKATDGKTAVQLMPVQDARASADHAYLAFTVVAPVDDRLGNIATNDVPLDVTVRQDAPAGSGCMAAATQSLTGQLVLRVLPELTNERVTPGLYSRIELGDLDQSGLGLVDPLILNAVSSIKLGTVSASASGAKSGPGGYSAGATPGPGGGGDAQAAAVVGNGGGGGGAGFTTAGSNGAAGSATGGRGGTAVGEAQIRSLAGNRAGAGGRGGAGLAALGSPVAPGVGGGGGGTVAMFAGGDIIVADVIADGGDGGNGAVTLTGSGGGGGGGAGGTIIARSQNGKLALGTVHVRSGNGGSPGGGMGSPGRVRWDSPIGEPPSSPESVAHRGPSFVDPVHMVTTRDQAFTLIGSSGDEVDIRLSDDHDVSRDAGRASFNGAGKATITPQLFPGYNRLCARLSGGEVGESVANACIDVAFLP